MTNKAFQGDVLGRYHVDFLLCDSCGSLQAENPYWLDESYETAIALSDTGAVARNLECHPAIVGAAGILRLRGRFLDFGGGAGLLCRLLRDTGIDAYMCDKFSTSVYARGFVRDLGQLRPGGVALFSAI